MSTTDTSLPRSARQAPVVSPTYPAPMTATLLKPGRLSQHGLVCLDGFACGLVPAVLPGALQSGASPPLRLVDQLGGRVAQGVAVPIRDQDPGVADQLDDARVAEGRDRAAARHRFQAWQAETLVPAGEQKAARRRVEVRQLFVDDAAKLHRAGHAGRRLPAGDSGDEKAEV